MRVLRLVLMCVIAWTMQAGVSFAEADWWDHLSGPGAFVGIFVDYRFMCFSSPTVAGRTETVATFLKPWDRTAIPRWKKLNVSTAALDSSNEQNRRAIASRDCKRDVLHDSLIATYRFAASYSNNVVPRNSSGDEAVVRINAFEFGHVRRLRNGWALRNSFGFNRFSGKQFSTFWKESNTIALEFAPYAVAPKPEEVERAYRVKVIMGVKILYGDFESSAFCNRVQQNPQCAAVTPHHYGVDVIPGVSFVIDRGLW